MTQNLNSCRDVWRAEDYSWEGLAKKPWHGWCVLPDGTVKEDPSSWPEGDARHGHKPEHAKPASLQDYWSEIINKLKIEEKDYLIHLNESGKNYTIMHFPFANDIDAIHYFEYQKIIMKHAFTNSKDVECSADGLLIGPDYRAQLQGCTFVQFNIRELIANAHREELVTANACFSNCIFLGEASFYRCRLNYPGSLEKVSFSSGCSFQRAEFPQDVMFRGAYFGHDADFRGARFHSDVSFEGAGFSSNALFERAVFMRRCEFRDAKFAGLAIFDDCHFHWTASFSSIFFERGARFNRSLFIHNANFNLSVFVLSVGFDKANFYSQMSFVDAIFCQTISLENCVTRLDANLSRASVLGPLHLKGAIFCGSAYFKGDVAGLIAAQSASAHNWGFKGRAQWGAQEIYLNFIERMQQGRRSYASISAEEAVFLGDCDFQDRESHGPCEFRGARFYKSALFHGGRLHQSSNFIDAIFEASLAPSRQCNSSANGDIAFKVPDWALRRLHDAERCRREIKGEHPITFAEWARDFEDGRAKDAADFRALPQEAPDNSKGPSKGAYYAKLEDAFRTLKQAMEANRDRQGEARFFQLELLARRKGRDLRLPWWERCWSYPYEWVSDFGNSVRRPLLWLLGLWVVMAVVYAPTATFPVRFPKLTEVGEALSFSGGRIVPFGPWAGDPSACSVGGRLLRVHPTAVELEAEEACKSDLKNVYGSGTAFWVSILATLQSAFALVLIFLAGVAARRRFQIN